MNEIPEIRCLEARGLSSAFLDGELSPVDDLRLDVHLESCDSCRKQHGELALIASLLCDHGSDVGAPPPWSALRRRLKEQAEGGPKPELDDASGLGKLAISRLGAIPSRARLWLATGSLAASFALGFVAARWFHPLEPSLVNVAQSPVTETVELSRSVGIPELDAYLEEYRAREVPFEELASHVDFEPRMPRRLPGGYEIARSYVVREQGRANTCLLYRRGDQSIALLERDAELPAVLRGGGLIERRFGGFSCLVTGRGETRVLQIAPPGDPMGLRLTLVLREGDADIDELVRYLGRGEAF